MTDPSLEDDELSTPDDDAGTPDGPTASSGPRTGPVVARVAGALALVLALGVAVAAVAMHRDTGNATMAVTGPTAMTPSPPPGAVAPSAPAPPSPLVTFVITALPTDLSSYLDGIPVLDIPAPSGPDGKPFDIEGTFACSWIRAAMADTLDPALDQRLQAVVEFGPDSSAPQVAADSKTLGDRLNALKAARAAGQPTVQAIAAVRQAGTDLEAACTKAGLTH